jgi:uncharacterized membrane protein
MAGSREIRQHSHLVQIAVRGWWLLAVVVVVLNAYAESRLSGTVQDSTGAVIPNAEIQVINQATAVLRTFTTDSKGRFSTELSAGTYTVRVQLTGFKTLEQTDVKLNEGEALDLQLIPTGEPPPPKKKR